MDLLVQLKALNDKGFFESAELLGNFLISNDTTNSVAETFVFFGDALFGREQYSRALDYYQIASKRKPISVRLSEIKWKIGRCYEKLNEDRSAVAVLESIPMSERGAEVQAALGKLHHRQGAHKAAVACYIEALKQCPYASECVLALVELGVSWADLQILYARTPNDAKWLGKVAESHQLAHQYDYKGALLVLDPLSQAYPRNLHLLERMASCYVHTGQLEQAHLVYDKIRQQDAKYLQGVGTFACVLKAKGQTDELNRLSAELTKIAPNQPETWAVVSVYVDTKGQREKSLAFLDRALALDERYVEALIIKGGMLLSLGLHKEAAASYRKAYLLRKDYSALQGVVRAYLGMQKIAEAAGLAREAYKLMPRNAKVLTLYGLVLSHLPHTREAARKILDSAVALESTSIETVLALAQLDVIEQKYADAAVRMEAQLAHSASEVLHVRLAEVLGQLQRYEDALHHYHSALTLNPDSEPAKMGLEQVEKTMRGLPLDAELDTGEEEEEDQFEDHLDESLTHG